MPELSVQALYVLSGVILYAMLHHFVIGLTGEKSALHRLFAAICFFALALAVVHSQTLKAAGIPAYLRDMKLEITLALMLVYLVAWFVTLYTERPLRRLLPALGIVYAILIALNISAPYSLQYDQFEGLSQEAMFWGETITRPHGHNGLLAYLTVLTVALSYGYAFWILLVDYRRKRERTERWMLFAFGFMLLATAEGILVRLGLLHALETGAFGVVGMIVMMSAVYIRGSRLQLLASEHNFYSLFDNSPTAMAAIDPKTGRMLEVNQIALDMIGYSREEFLARTLRDITADDDEEAMAYRMERLATGKASLIHFEGRFRHKDGNRFATDTYLSAMRDKTGKVVKLIASAIDITLRKRIEDNLRESEEKLRNLYEMSPVGIALTDMNGRYVEFNQAFEAICGYPADELKRLDYWALTPREYERQEAAQLDALRKTGCYGPYEKEYIRADGTRIPLRFNGALVRGRDGKEYIWSFVEDIAETHRAQMQIERESEKNRAFLRNASDGVHILDAAGHIIEASDSFCAMLGRSRDEVLGMHVSQWDDMMTGPEIRERMAEVFRQHERIAFETRHRRKDGSVITVEVASYPLELEGEPVLFNSSRDITARKVAEHALRESETRFHTLFAMAPVGISFSRDGVMLGANDAYKRMHGYGPDEDIAGRRAADLFAPRVRDDIQARIDRRAGGSETVSSYESVGLRKDGTEFPKLISATRVEMADGPMTFAYTIDFSELKRREDELALSRQVLIERNESLRLINQLSQHLHGSIVVDEIVSETMSALLNMSHAPRVAIYLLDPEQAELRLAASHGFEDPLSVLGKRLPLSGSLSGQALTDGNLLACRDIAADHRLEPAVKAALVMTGVRSGIVIPMRYEEQPVGTINLVYLEQREFSDMELEALKAFSNTVALAIANARNVQRLAYQARHDSLTGLAKRSVLHDEFARQAQAPRSGQIALILLDLNRFKEINDTLGHHVGDRLLKEIGPRLEEALGGRRALACRLGGDEFAIMLTELAKVTDAAEVAEEVMRTFKRPFMADGMALQVGASIGVAYFPEHGSDSHSLLRAADVAMYRAKSLGKGVVVYDRSFDGYSPERLAMATELIDAVERGQLVLHYQPKADIATGAVVGFEALVRWQHPRLGLLYPGSFLPLVEMSEVIHPFTQAVMDQAMRDKRKLHDSGYLQPVAINLSARNLMDARCVSNLDLLFGRHALPQDEIELELTETALMHDPDSAVALLHRIAAMGIGIAIDDFGTGYSSLAYLRRLPLKTLKIDRSFVMGMQDNLQDGIIVRSTVALAHNLGLKVIAEGVESAAVLESLRDMGCDQIQGYHLCKPLPLADLQSWLQAR